MPKHVRGVLFNAPERRGIAAGGTDSQASFHAGFSRGAVRNTDHGEDMCDSSNLLLMISYHIISYNIIQYNII